MCIRDRFYRVCVDYICGVRPTIDGLQVDPCIPPDWDELRVKRDFRGTTYDIFIKNPKHVSCGVEKILVNGQECGTNILPLLHEGTCEVEVVMGKNKLNKGINLYR
jgi:cellobiose phosphorylase